MTERSSKFRNSQFVIRFTRVHARHGPGGSENSVRNPGCERTSDHLDSLLSAVPMREVVYVPVHMRHVFVILILMRDGHSKRRDKFELCMVPFPRPGPSVGTRQVVRSGTHTGTGFISTLGLAAGRDDYDTVRGCGGGEWRFLRLLRATRLGCAPAAACSCSASGVALASRGAPGVAAGDGTRALHGGRLLVWFELRG